MNEPEIVKRFSYNGKEFGVLIKWQGYRSSEIEFRTDLSEQEAQRLLEDMPTIEFRTDLSEQEAQRLLEDMPTYDKLHTKQIPGIERLAERYDIEMEDCITDAELVLYAETKARTFAKLKRRAKLAACMLEHRNLVTKVYPVLKPAD